MISQLLWLLPGFFETLGRDVGSRTQPAGPESRPPKRFAHWVWRDESHPRHRVRAHRTTRFLTRMSHDVSSRAQLIEDAPNNPNTIQNGCFDMRSEPNPVRTLHIMFESHSSSSHPWQSGQNPQAVKRIDYPRILMCWTQGWLFFHFGNSLVWMASAKQGRALFWQIHPSIHRSIHLSIDLSLLSIKSSVCICTCIYVASPKKIESSNPTIIVITDLLASILGLLFTLT